MPDQKILYQLSHLQVQKSILQTTFCTDSRQNISLNIWPRLATNDVAPFATTEISNSMIRPISDKEYLTNFNVVLFLPRDQKMEGSIRP